MISRPYLLEAVSGSKFNAGQFVVMIGFIAVFVVIAVNLAEGKGKLKLSNVLRIGSSTGVASDMGGLINVGEPVEKNGGELIVQADATPEILNTPMPVLQEIQSENLQSFIYSWYNPALGGVNCFNWSYSLGDCISNLANGENWRFNYDKAIACPMEYPFGTVVRVVSPTILAGDWICKDRGGLITGNVLDFLRLNGEDIEFNSEVIAEVILPSE
jgi:hypothetical protein